MPVSSCLPSALIRHRSFLPSSSSSSPCRRQGPLRGPLGAPHLYGTQRGPLLWGPRLSSAATFQLQQQRAFAGLSSIWGALQDRLRGYQRGPQRGPQGAPPIKGEEAQAPPIAGGPLGGPLGVSKSSEVIQQQLMKIYKNVTPEEREKMKRQKGKDPVYFRELSLTEFNALREESAFLLKDKHLWCITPRQTAQRELPIQRHLRAPVQQTLYRVFRRHQEYPQIAWQLLHLILERVENEELKKTFGIGGGFNGPFYLLVLHLWMFNCRLMQSSKSKKSSFFNNPLLSIPYTNTRALTSSSSSSSSSSNSSSSSSRMKDWFASWLPQRITPLTPEEVREALTRRVYVHRMMQIAAEASSNSSNSSTKQQTQTITQTANVLLSSSAAASTAALHTAEGAPKKALKGAPKEALKGALKEAPKETLKGALKGAPKETLKGAPKGASEGTPIGGAPKEGGPHQSKGFEGGPLERPLEEGPPLGAPFGGPPPVPEGLGLAIRISALRAEVSGEILNEVLFRQVWGLIRDWLKIKKVGEFQFQAELKNCQAYAFGLMVSLDQAMTEGEICPARIKEALWGNVYGGSISYEDPRLSLLTVYLIRQLLHVLQISEQHFFEARFTWADFPLAPNFLAPPLLPPLSLPVCYGGFKPSGGPPTKPSKGPLLKP